MVNIPVTLQQKPVPLYNYDDLIYYIKRRLQENHEITRNNLVRTNRKDMRIKRIVYMPVFQEGVTVL
jgi:hypothetical protein